jgi:hypothetical protein
MVILMGISEVEKYNLLVGDINTVIDKIVAQVNIMAPDGYDWFTSSYENVSDKIAWKIRLDDGWLGDDVDARGFMYSYELYIDSQGNLMSLIKDDKSEVTFWDTVGKPFSSVTRLTEIQDPEMGLNLVGTIKGSRGLELLLEELDKFYMGMLPVVDPPKHKKSIGEIFTRFLERIHFFDPWNVDDW